MARMSFKKIRLWFAYIVFAVFPFVGRISPLSWTLGTIILAVGLVIRFWASGYILKTTRLATAGPYAHTRNPLYVGNFLLGLGIVVMGRNVWLVLYYTVMFWFIYDRTIAEEEAVLGPRHGAAFQDYRASVPAFWPSLKRYPRAEKRTFDGQQSFKNGEYIRLFGFLLLPPFFYLWGRFQERALAWDAAVRDAVFVFIVFFVLLWLNIYVRRAHERRQRGEGKA
jgi:hypothetical protein